MTTIIARIARCPRMAPCVRQELPEWPGRAPASRFNNRNKMSFIPKGRGMEAEEHLGGTWVGTEPIPAEPGGVTASRKGRQFGWDAWQIRVGHWPREGQLCWLGCWLKSGPGARPSGREVCGAVKTAPGGQLRGEGRAGAARRSKSEPKGWKIAGSSREGGSCARHRTLLSGMENGQRGAQGPGARHVSYDGTSNNDNDNKNNNRKK